MEDVGDRAPDGPVEQREVGPQKADEAVNWQSEKFVVVEQLRGVNAMHLLQLAGHHLSRVGMDFLPLPKEGRPA